MMRKNPCYDTMTPAGQIVNRVALQDVKGEWPLPVPNTPHPIDEYDDWFRKYNALYGHHPISVAMEAAYRVGWEEAVSKYERHVSIEKLKQSIIQSITNNKTIPEYPRMALIHEIRNMS